VFRRSSTLHAQSIALLLDSLIQVRLEDEKKAQSLSSEFEEWVQLPLGESDNKYFMTSFSHLRGVV